jgi:hypothetical protein
VAYIGRPSIVGNFVKLDSITAVNGQAAYTMQNSSANFTDYSSVNQFMVSLNGTIQSPGSSFTVSGSTITFASNLVTNDVIDFIIVFGNSLSSGVPTDATVSTAKIVDNAVTPPKTNFFNTDPGNAADLGYLHVKTADSGGSANADASQLVLEGSTNAGLTILGGTGNACRIHFGDSGDNDIGFINYAHDDNALLFGTNASTAAKIDSSANLQFNSGFGSVGTAYGVRAWVNFDGDGTVSIRESGNVSSVTDNGTGDYTVNFSNNMPDTDFSCVGASGLSASSNQTFFQLDKVSFSNAGEAQVATRNASGARIDSNLVCVAILR